MTYDADETGIETSRPREAYEFVLPAVTYRFTSAEVDMEVGGQTYRAVPIRRSALAPAIGDGSRGEIEIEMNVSNPVAQRYLRGGVPPRRIDVNVYRQQQSSGEHQLVWAGRVAGMSCDRHLARLLVVQGTPDALARRLPTITVRKDCPHVLYDGRCLVNRNMFRVVTTTTAVNGRDVVVASIGGNPNGWATFGEIVHVPSGERMTVLEQVGTSIKLHLPVDMQAGDAVEVFAGCDHTIGTCADKFTNQINFGSFPHLPKSNPYVANGDGIYTSE